jgi:Family of unknown function (DUF6188)
MEPSSASASSPPLSELSGMVVWGVVFTGTLELYASAPDERGAPSSERCVRLVLSGRLALADEDGVEHELDARDPRRGVMQALQLDGHHIEHVTHAPDGTLELQFREGRRLRGHAAPPRD